MNSRKLLLLGCACVLGVLLAPAPGAASTLTNCVPSCDGSDSRMLAITPGTNLETLTDEVLELQISVDGSAATFELGFFDGDLSPPHWDVCRPCLAGMETKYTLIADPLNDGTGTFVVTTFDDALMPDNEWADFTVTNAPEALSPSGNYIYRLLAELDVGASPPGAQRNSLKLRTSAVASIELFQQPFGFIAALTGLADAAIVYPEFDLLDIPGTLAGGTTFDGDFSFFIELATTQEKLVIWGGDLDHGKFDCSVNDTDDPNSPATPDLSADGFSTAGTTPTDEGVAVGTLLCPGGVAGVGPFATGAPPDDTNPSFNFGLTELFLRSPSIFFEVYRVEKDNSRTLFAVNDNPSGNEEWEKFRIDSTANPPAPDPDGPPDATVPRLDAGVYEVRVRGLDLENLNAFFFTRLLCTDSLGNPCDSPPDPFLLGTTVWGDDDGDGDGDPAEIAADGESGIPGVILRLLDGLGGEIARTLTDGSGLYEFPTEAGTRTVEVAPENFTGAVARGALGDRVFLDADGDGLQDDPGDPGLPGVTVRLVDAGPDLAVGGGDDVVLDVAATDGDGRYRFSGLAPGTYYTEVADETLPAGLTLAVGTDPSPLRTISAAEVFLDLDFGYAPAAGTAVVGDRVWHDLDSDGLQDPGEPGIDGVTLDLLDGGGTPVATVTTAGGYYLFGGVAPGSYRVDVTDTAGALAGYSLTTANDPTALFPVAAGDALLDKDFGYVQAGLFSIFDVVWFDADRSGFLDGGESGLAGVTVTLASASGDPLDSTTTGPGGSFSFTGLPDGDYFLVVSDLAGVVSDLLPTTLPALDGVLAVTVAGADVSNVSFGYVDQGALEGLLATTPSPSQTDTVVDENILTYDFGYRFGAIGDRVWVDADGDGIQDGSEPGIPGVTVELLDAGGSVIATDVTDGGGFYGFDRVRGGLYSVRVDPTTLPPGMIQTFDLDGLSTPHLAAAALGAGEVRDDADFGYRVVCDLAVEKTCQVVPEPLPFACSDAKPLDVVGMIWDGSATVDVKAWKGSVGSTLLTTLTGVVPGQEVAVAGYAGSPNDVVWQIFAAGGSTELGRSKFHLSCSDSEMNGPEDCGKRQGDGKSNEASLVNDWLLDRLEGSGLALDCSPAPPPASDLCEVVGQPVPSCESLGDPDALTFRFTGGGCAATAHGQEPGKHVCTESSPGIDGGQPATVVADDGSTHFVDPGEELTLSRSASKAITITQTGREEVHEIHVSCSQPLAAGDVYGSLTLSAFDGQRAGAEVIYGYTVSNAGAPLSGVTLVDDQLGLVGGPVSLPSPGAESFSVSARVTETTTNRVDVTGLAAFGTVCTASDQATVIVTEPCFECDGGTTDLTFEYLGAASASVVVYDDKDPKADEILFSGTVAPGDPVVVTRRPGQSKLSSDISLWIDGVRNTKVHTSCSQPIGAGLIVGDFRIVEARSRNNGLMCELETCDPDGSAAPELKDRELKWEITNRGEAHLVIEKITLAWPGANGDLVEIKRDGDVIHKGDFSPPSAVVDSGWEGDPDKRQIKAGETDTLKLKFQNDASSGGDYTVTVEFDQGCSVSLQLTPPAGGGDFECSKPIDALTMVWDGSAPVRIKAYKGSVGSTQLADVDGIGVGAEVTVTGFAGSPNDVFWEVFAAGTATKLGESKFHLSCSDSEMDGPEDCGKRQGDGKGNDSGLVNDWLLEGMVGSQGALDCTP